MRRRGGSISTRCSISRFSSWRWWSTASSPADAREAGAATDGEWRARGAHRERRRRARPRAVARAERGWCARARVASRQLVEGSRRECRERERAPRAARGNRGEASAHRARCANGAQLDRRSGALSAPAAPEVKRRTLPSPTPLRPLLARLRPYWRALALGTLALLVSSAIGLAFPLVVRELLDAAFVKGDGGLLNKLALVLVLIFAVQGVLSFVQVWLITAVAEKVIAKLRSQLFAHLVRLSPGFFADQRTGELTSRLSTDLTLLQSVMTYQSTELMRQLVYLVGGIVQDRVADAMGTADEAFSQIRIVQSFTRETAESERYDAQLGDVVEAAIHRALVRGVFFCVITFAGFAGVAAVLWQGGRLVLAHQLTGGALVEFLFYAFFVAAAVGALGQLFGAYQEAIGAARRVFDLLETKPTIADPAARTALPRPVRGDVRLADVTFRYGDELPDVLHDVSFL